MTTEPKENKNKLASNPTLQEWFTKTTTERVLDTEYLPKWIFNMPQGLAKILASLLGIKGLIPAHQSIPPDLTGQSFSEEGLKALGIPIEVEDNFADKIPKEGPLVIVCNHPYGGIDGMALMARLLEVRPDAKLLVNVMLGVFPELRQCCYPLDVLSSDSEARGLNMASLRLANKHLSEGGAVVFFPSGTVSHWQWRKGITDPKWLPAPARFAIRHDAPILPIYFHGRNSTSFNIAGLIHPLVRTLLLPREMLLRKGKPIKISVGRVIETSTFKFLRTPEAITAYARMRCYALGNDKKLQPISAQDERPMEPVAEPHDPKAIAKAFEELPSQCLLHKEKGFAIYVIKSGQSPILLEELGSLREHTFRMVGEGSGKARDLDIYDERYYHLLLWDEEKMCLVGAYRLGKVQEIMASHGKEGLYTDSLFRMTDDFFRRYEHSLELGRAVIHPSYQREYAPLMLLWKGIGKFIMQHEDIRCLFGPVSLSLDYTPQSLRAAVEYLKEQCGNQKLSTMVKGRHFPKRLFYPSKDFPLPDTLNYNGLVALVRDIEGGRGIPILFKHYLKLGGQIGAFHMDTAFNTLDAFLLMDLVDSPKYMLERYMGKDDANTFLSRWKPE